MNAIEIQSLRKTYDTGDKALKGIDLNIKQGSFFGLLGPNGAGKTTTIGILTGLVNKTSGSAKILGHDIITDFKPARKSIGLSPQEINLDVFFTIKELLTFQGGYYGLSIKESKIRTQKILSDLGLEDKINSKARELSGGMKRRVQIAKALIHDPEVIILDEPTAGVDIELRHLLWKSLKDMNTKKEKTMLLTTHYIEEAEYLCDEVAIIDNGKIIAQGAPSKLIESDGISVINMSVDRWDEKYLINRKTSYNNGVLSIESKNTDQDIPKIIGELSEVGIIINKLDIKKASLEDVFVKLTGKMMAE